MAAAAAAAASKRAMRSVVLLSMGYIIGRAAGFCIGLS